MLSPPEGPIFVVGCSRGGTTLLQSILHRHPALVSFPETNILYTLLDDLDYRRYGRVIGRRRIPLLLLMRCANALGYTRSYSPQVFHRFLDQIGREDLRGLVPPATRSIARACAAFTRIMETIADGRRYVEKTPQNIFCIELIARHVAHARFVHIVRDGRENIASLHAATQRYPDFRCRFGGSHGLRKMIGYWNNSLEISRRYARHAGHVVVRYEDVVAAPKEALRPVGALLGIEIADDMLRYDTAGISLGTEVWKRKPSTEIAPQPAKFDATFSPEERRMVEALALPADRYFPRRSG